LDIGRGGALVEGILNASRGELLLIGEDDDAVAGGDVGPKGDAGRRNLRLGECAGVLGVEGRRDEK
jgi:hypothetical protein